MISPGEVIKHKAFMDVAVQIIFALLDPETNNLEVRGIWINRGQSNSFIINSKQHPEGIPAEFIIKQKHLQNWLKCNKQIGVSFKDAEWKELS